MADFHPWPSIEAFKSVVHNSKTRGVVTYRGKVKLHGTNAGITFDNGDVVAQSRSRIISPESDNMGFAAWAANSSLSPRIASAHTVFGEWCGPGVQRGVAISQIGRRVFAVFAVLIDGVYITDPESLEELCPRHEDTFVLPWMTEPFDINFKHIGRDIVDRMNADVAIVEKSDPWVKSLFDIDGTGEEIVYYPTLPHGIGQLLSADCSSSEYLGRRVFKAKGEAHRVNGHKEAVSVNTAQLEGVPEFVEFSVTEARLQQALAEIGGDPDITKTGDFLKWVQQDIVKECSDELAQFSLQKKALGACGSAAVQWFKHQCQGVA